MNLKTLRGKGPVLKAAGGIPGAVGAAKKRQLSERQSDTENNKKWWSSFCSTQDKKKDKEAKQETSFSTIWTFGQLPSKNAREIFYNRN